MTASILITGASSGLGAALAEIYSAPGTRLFLGGRDLGRLEKIAKICSDKGAETTCEAVDVTDRESMTAWINRSDAIRPLTLVIANAGISGGTGGRLGETAEQTQQIFAANLDGVLNTILPVIPLMQGRRRGQIAVMASLAGFRGLPSAPAYAASKAAVKVWGEGLRGWLKRSDIGVSVICPGFVKTAMTAPNKFPMPFLMNADKAAGIMRRGIDANRARIAFPFPLAFLVWLLASVPPHWADAVLARAAGKT